MRRVSALLTESYHEILRRYILRIKGALILKRNATRDYLDFIALADYIGDDGFVAALRAFDELCPQPNGESALQQLQIQLAQPLPYDLDEVNLAEYKRLDQRWHEWQRVCAVANHYAALIFDRITGLEA